MENVSQLTILSCGHELKIKSNMLKVEGMGLQGWRGLKSLVALEIEDVFQSSKERRKKEQQGSSRLNNSDTVSNRLRDVAMYL